MKKIIFVIFCLMCTRALTQTFRLHVGGGFANYLGDLQQKRFSFSQVKALYSFGAAYDINDFIAIRTDFSQGHVAGDDRKGSAKMQKRNLNFESSITEVSLLGEYTWINKYSAPFVPYFFTGIGVFKFSPYSYDNAGRKVFLHDLSTEGQGLAKYPTRKTYKLTQFNIPFGGGMRYNISPSIFITGEMGVRKLFSDYLDDVSTSFVDRAELLKAKGQTAVDMAFRADEIPPYNAVYPKDGSQRGNKDKDWYYFGQMRISFRLGWNDGYGGKGPRTGNKGFLRRLGCPGRF